MIGKKNKKHTLSDKISDLLKAPELHDPEDDIYEETKAKTVDADSDFENNEELDTVLSSFRKQNAKLLQDIDKKYVGKPVSRKTLGLEAFENESGVSSAEDESGSENEKSVGAFVKINTKRDDNSDDDSIVSKDSLQNSHEGNKQFDISDNESDELSDISDSEDKQRHNASEIDSDQLSDISNELSKSKDKSDFSENSESDDEDAEGDVGITDYESTKELTEKSNFKHVNSGNASETVQKGNAVRQQLHVWEKLMEMRIHSQKILLSANKLPRYNEFNDFLGQPNSEFGDKARESKQLLTKLLNKFIDLQQLLLKKYPETKNLTKSGENKTTSDEAGDGMDEEIPSDTEEEIEDKSEDEAEIPTKRRKISDIPHILSQQHGLYSSYRNAVIQKWHDKVRVASGVMNNKNLSTSSLIKHIEYILNDKERLRKRTQLKRSKYDILTLNKPEEVTEISQTDNNEIENCGIKQNEEEFNPEIFDDDDFYHQLLRELIEYKTANVSDPVQLSKQWIELQQLRNKMKRKIDTKATKGRRIRYTVHSKLVNFMAPEENSTWTEDAKDELFGSIFGGKMKAKVLDASSSK